MKSEAGKYICITTQIVLCDCLTKYGLNILYCFKTESHFSIRVYDALDFSATQHNRRIIYTTLIKKGISYSPIIRILCNALFILPEMQCIISCETDYFALLVIQLKCFISEPAEGIIGVCIKFKCIRNLFYILDLLVR